MNPLDLDLPERIVIELPAMYRRALRQIADREPHENDEKLVQRIMMRGIVATFAAEVERQGDEALEQRLRSLRLDADSERGELAASASRPFPQPGVMYRKRQREQLEQAERDLAASNGPDGEDGVTTAPRQEVEKYIAAPITEAMRRAIQVYLDARRGMSEEEALVSLVQLGLNQVDPDKEGVERIGSRTKRAEKRLLLAERLHRRAAQRCQS